MVKSWMVSSVLRDKNKLEREAIVTFKKLW